MNLKVKICGLRTVEDALICAGEGADFIGFVFVPGSPRHITPPEAAKIAEAMRGRKGGPRVVGVFRNASVSDIKAVDNAVGLDLAQLHGDESSSMLDQLPLPVIKAFHVGGALPDTTAFRRAEWLLFDTLDADAAGGTGKQFDWALLQGRTDRRPFFLAGGLNPENVRLAVSVARPDAIDVSSGVEDSPGVKSPEKIAQFFVRLRRM